MSGDESEAMSDMESIRGDAPMDLEKGILFEPHIPVDEEEERPKVSPARRKWVCCTWALTWYIPVYI